MFKKTVKNELKNEVELLSVQKKQNYETDCTLRLLSNLSTTSHLSEIHLISENDLKCIL